MSSNYGFPSSEDKRRKEQEERERVRKEQEAASRRADTEGPLSSLKNTVLDVLRDYARVNGLSVSDMPWTYRGGDLIVRNEDGHGRIAFEVSFYIEWDYLWIDAREIASSDIEHVGKVLSEQTGLRVKISWSDPGTGHYPSGESDWGATR